MRGAVFNCRRGDAGGVRGDGAQGSVFGGAADCAFGRGWAAAADGRQLDAGVGGVVGPFGIGGADHCDHAVVVSGARFAAAWASSHFLEREGWTGAGDRGTLRVVLARAAFEVGAGTARVLGFAVAACGIVFLGAGVGAVEALAVWDGRVQRHCLASHGGRGGEPFVRGGVGRVLASDVDYARGERGALSCCVLRVQWVGYTAYIWLLEHVPTSKVSTYAYVNPVVAVFLGWLILHERVDRFIVMGSVIVILSVILVTSAKVKERVVVEELPAAGD